MHLQACVWWEPVVTPAITTQLSSEAEEHAAADFSSIPADLWLQLMQVWGVDGEGMVEGEDAIPMAV